MIEKTSHQKFSFDLIDDLKRLVTQTTNLLVIMKKETKFWMIEPVVEPAIFRLFQTEKMIIANSDIMLFFFMLVFQKFFYSTDD